MSIIPSRRQSGYTLVELAIALVIVGLLIVGAVAGRSLLQASELRGVISEIQQYKIAVDNFKVQYEGLPGDLVNATAFWPDADTVNGNNNGRIDADSEYYAAWHQLVLGKMIAGNYTGVGSDAIIATNVPRSRHNAAGYHMSWFSMPGGWVDPQGRPYQGNYLLFGRQAVATGGSDYLTSSALVPEEAFSIDSKIDNDQPDYGNVLADHGDGVDNCITDGAYDFSTTSVACVLYISID